MSAADYAAHQRAMLQRASSEQLYPLWEAEVVESVQKPTDLVRIRSVHSAGAEEFDLGYAEWQPRETLPRAGDICLVGLDVTHQPWVIQWQRSAFKDPFVTSLPEKGISGETIYYAWEAGGPIWTLVWNEAEKAWEYVAGRPQVVSHTTTTLYKAASTNVFSALATSGSISIVDDGHFNIGGYIEVVKLNNNPGAVSELTLGLGLTTTAIEAKASFATGVQNVAIPISLQAFGVSLHKSTTLSWYVACTSTTPEWSIGHTSLYLTPTNLT